MLRKVFGHTATGFIPTWTYNSLLAIFGAWFYTDTFLHFIGLVLILESLLVTIEPCWPKEERPS